MLRIQDIRREIKRAIAPFLPLLPPGSGPGSGDVVGPASSQDGVVVIFEGTTGKVIAGSDMRIEVQTDEVEFRPLNNVILHLQAGIGGGGSGPGEDMIISGGDAHEFGPPDLGGDLYMRGGYGTTQGYVHIEGTNIWMDGLVQQGPGWAVNADFAGGVNTDTIGALSTENITAFSGAIAVDDIYENTSDHGIHVHDTLYLDEDADSGIYSPANNAIGILAGGLEHMRVTPIACEIGYVPLTGDGSDYTLKLPDAISAGHGGDLFIEVADKEGALKQRGNIYVKVGIGTGTTTTAFGVKDATGNTVFTVQSLNAAPESRVDLIGGKLLNAANYEAQVGVTFDGGGSAIVAGQQFAIRIENGFTITGWHMLADQVGSIKIDIWKDDFLSYPPTDADTITAANEPDIVSANKGADLILSGWTTAVEDGDVLLFNVDSASTVERVTLILIGTKT